jgi:hypothetical protein
VIDNKIVIMSEAHGGVKTIVLLDSNATRVEDSFWCMWPSISPDRRYIAYTMVTQTNAAKAQTEFAAVYDFTKGATDNRLAWTGGDRNIDVGELLYPKQGSVAPRSVWRRPIHSLGTKYTWSADSKEIAFSDTLDEHGVVQNAPRAASHYDLIARNGGMGWQINPIAR